MTSTATRQRRIPENKPSHLLSAEENEILFNLLGRKCVSLASAVVQVLMSSPPSHTCWIKAYCGVACFVKDSVHRSYYIRVFDVLNKCLQWEQELYHEFIYETPRSFFHCFEAEKCQAGLNFADEDEANMFKMAVNEKLRARKQKLDKRKTQETNGVQPSSLGVSLPGLSKSMDTLSGKKKKKEKEKKNGKKKLTTADIGNPMDFIHVQHVGFDPQRGFDCKNVEEIAPELKNFFNEAGVQENHLADDKTRKFIYDFINKNGGIEMFSKKEQQQQQQQQRPPPVPMRETVTPPAPVRSIAPPPPPSRGTPNLHSLQSRAPPVGPPPPPPPAPATTMRNNNNVQQMNHVPMQNAKSAVCPPPPPPLPVIQAPPPPPPFPEMNGSAPKLDSRSALLDQIRRGKELHHVAENADSPPPEAPDSRGALLQQIRRGVELKAVNDQPKSRPPTPPMLDGLAAALNKALQERSQAMQCSDDSDSDEDDGYDDDEWE